MFKEKFAFNEIIKISQEISKDLDNILDHGNLVFIAEILHDKNSTKYALLSEMYEYTTDLNRKKVERFIDSKKKSLINYAKHYQPLPMKDFAEAFIKYSESSTDHSILNKKYFTDIKSNLIRDIIDTEGTDIEIKEDTVINLMRILQDIEFKDSLVSRLSFTRRPEIRAHLLNRPLSIDIRYHLGSLLEDMLFSGRELIIWYHPHCEKPDLAFIFFCDSRRRLPEKFDFQKVRQIFHDNLDHFNHLLPNRISANTNEPSNNKK